MVVFVELFFVQKDIKLAVGREEEQNQFFSKLWIFTLALIVYGLLSLYFFYHGAGSLLLELVRVKIFRSDPTIEIPVRDKDYNDSSVAPSVRIAPRIGSNHPQSGYRPAAVANSQLMSTSHRIQFVSGTNLPNTFGRVTNQVEIAVRLNPNNDVQSSSYLPGSFIPESQISHPYIQNPATYNAIRFERHSQDSGTNLDAFGMQPRTEQRPVGQEQANPNIPNSLSAPRTRAFISSVGRENKANPVRPIMFCKVPFSHTQVLYTLFGLDAACGSIALGCIVTLLNTGRKTNSLIVSIACCAVVAAVLSILTSVWIPRKVSLNDDDYKRELIDIEDEERSAESKEERIVTITVPRFLVKLAADYYRLPDNYDILKLALDPATTGRPMSSKRGRTAEDFDMEGKPPEAERESRIAASGVKDMVESKKSVVALPKDSQRKKQEPRLVPLDDDKDPTTTSCLDGKGPPGNRKVYLFQVHTTKFKHGPGGGLGQPGIPAKTPRAVSKERLSPLIQDSNNLSREEEAGQSEPPEVSLRRNTHSQTIRTDKPELSKGETQAVTEKEACFVCFDAAQTGVFMPCGHGGVCVSCAVEMWGKAAVCHLCKGAVECMLQIDPVSVASIVKVMFVYVADQGKGAGLGLNPPIERGSEVPDRGSHSMNPGQELDNASVVAQDQRRRGSPHPRRQPI